VPTKYLAIAFLSIVLPLFLIWEKGILSSPRNQKDTIQTQQNVKMIEAVIDQSNTLFQTAEVYFTNKNYEAALRTYEQCIDSFFQSGIDIFQTPHLERHYDNLYAQIIRKRIAVDQAAFADALGKFRDRKSSDERSSAWAAPILDPQRKERAESIRNLKVAIADAHLGFTVRPDVSIQRYMRYHQRRGRSAMRSGLRRSGLYIDMARDIFRKEGVPPDLVWMAQVESAWSPLARSRASAVGLWQFIPATGRYYGLLQNEWIDQRMSFECATRASARYLRWLGDRYYGNWALALAAYNAGETAVDRTIAKAGHRNFWKIRKLGLLPKETCDYVPNILATIIIGKNPRRYGFHVQPDRALSYDTILAKRSVSLRFVAEALDEAYESLEKLNPELQRGVTPPGMTYRLRIPPGKRNTLQTMLERIPTDGHAAPVDNQDSRG
jgi:tetratricopeptide (TPR) repeat protein